MIYRSALFAYHRLPTRVQELILWVVFPKATIGVYVVALDDRERVLLFQHRFDAAGVFRLPGGNAQRKEPPHVALLRELAEEGGASVYLGGVAHLEVSDRWPARLAIYYEGTLVHLPVRTTDEVSSWTLRPADALPVSLGPCHRRAIHAALRKTHGG